MKKRIGILSVLLVMLLPFGTVFADHSEGLLRGKTTIDGNGYEVYELTDGNHSTYYDINAGTLRYVFDSDYTFEAFSYFIDMGTGLDIDIEVTFYNDGSLVDIVTIDNTQNNTEQDLVNSVIADEVRLKRVGGATYKRVYEFEVYGHEYVLPTDPTDTTPPSNVTNVSQVVTDSNIYITYDLPPEPDFSHVKIYRDGKLIADNVKINSYTDQTVTPDTTYTYTIESVDDSGNVSSGTVFVVTSGSVNDTLPPSVPTGLKVSIGNSSLLINWSENKELDLDGYNLYVNGTKYNSSLIKSNNYTINNLNNGMDYEIQVSAVDTSGNESALTSIVTGSPSVDAMPIFSLGYDLTDVADSSSAWFSSLWMLLAFSVAIPLSFYIANRVKSLFLA